MGSRKYQPDVDAILARRHDNGSDYWASADGRLGVGDPFSTLTALLILHELQIPRTHEAVEGALRLDHRVVGRPIGPCHFGIGTLFLQVEYPLLRYNLFNYVYVLSFYDRARDDPRYREALGLFQSKLAGERSRGGGAAEPEARGPVVLRGGAPVRARDGPVSRDREEPGTMISLLARG